MRLLTLNSTTKYKKENFFEQNITFFYSIRVNNYYIFFSEKRRDEPCILYLEISKIFSFIIYIATHDYIKLI